MELVSPPVLLSTLTTLQLGGPAPRFTRADTDEAIVEAVTNTDAGSEQLLLVAGGSNLVIADEGVDSPVVQIANRGVTCTEDGADLIVEVAAGESWEPVVEQFVADGWSGIASLSGIPGSCGATPIQNVGAYGVEVGEVLVDVTVYDRRRGQRSTIEVQNLGLGYRTSVLRGQSDLVVLSLRMRLTKSAETIRYGALAAALGVAPGRTAPPAAVREAVLQLRRGKGMVIDPADPDTRSVGSFFTNPLLTADEALAADARIRTSLGEDIRYPHYPADEHTKLSAAWLIERAGFAKGFALPGGGAAISSKHTLALTNRGGTTADLLALARHVRDGVDDAFGIELQAEPILVGVSL